VLTGFDLWWSNLKLAVTRNVISCVWGWNCLSRRWEDMAMRFSSLFVARLTVASTLLLSGLSGTAMSQTATPSGSAATSLPNIVVEAPKRVARPERPAQRAAAHSTVSRRATVAARTPSAAPGSVSAKLAKLASATGSCAGGCQSSFKSGNEPWHGCSLSSGSWLQFCRNVGNYKTFAECVDAGLTTGWGVNEAGGYCRALAMAGAFGKSAWD
jgi:hypothetical protein